MTQLLAPIGVPIVFQLARNLALSLEESRRPLGVERMRLGKPAIGAPPRCEIEVSAYHRRYGQVLELLERVEHESPVAVIRFDSMLCNAARCLTSVDGVSIYHDDAHFSYGGIEYLGKRMSLASEVEELAR